ncbi:MAG TPA: RNB domain-containing ribonuclease [Novosphingobium sp.]|nr:RNB domain-containing ribonuclease [Novosphingobium sp.]
MKALSDPQRLLGDGLAAIREQYAVPPDFAPEVLAEAERTKVRPPTEHADWTQREFITLDPASSTDLDQAFVIEPGGADLILHYALADIGWFVPAGGAMEAEAWTRGLTLYLPDGKARLYPAALSEAAASLLPDGPRPAIVASVRCARDGAVRLDGVVRAVVRSRAKLAYDSVDIAAVPHFADFAARMKRGEDARGAARVDPPEQEVERDDQGRFHLSFRPWLPSETANAALSLAANMAIADALLAARTGLFREMPPPDERALRRLRNTARALGLTWPENATLAQFERTVDPATVAGAAFQFAVRRAGRGAHYAPFVAGHVPWHAALGATYTHATAPMRRLADRYVLEGVLAVANGRAVPEDCAAAFARLPAVMDAADAREGAVERAVVDLAETALLAGRVGEVFDAVVTDRDERGARIQLGDWPVVARVDAHRIAAGDALRVRLAEADPVRRVLRFERVN